MKLFSHRPARTPVPPAAADAMHSAATAAPDAVHESLTQQIGRELLAEARALHQPTLFSDRLMEWTLRDPHFKTQLFRFIDVFPVLKTPAQIHDHLLEYLTQPGINPPHSLPRTLSLALSAGGLFKATLASTIATQITSMAHAFIAGETPAGALPVLRQLRDRHIAFSVDLLGEACLSDAEAAAYQTRYLDLLRTLPKETAAWPADAILDINHLGQPLPRSNVSIKISALYARTKPVAFEASLAGLTAALAPILTLARETNTLINFDMEQHNLKDLTLALFERCLTRFDFPAALAIQAYLRSVDADLARLTAFAQRTGKQFTVRLIKGAYWDYETIHARLNNWPSPVWSRKADTDAAFERATRTLIAQTPRSPDQPGIFLALGSHNLRSIAHALACLRTAGLPDSALEIQMLHGMAEPLKAALAASHLRLREYVPIGKMIPGMAYLVRRLLENTSNDSWLRHATLDKTPAEELLAPPAATTSATSHAAHASSPAPSADPAASVSAFPIPHSAFQNAPHRDFSSAPARESFAQALAENSVPSVPISTTLPEAQSALSAAARAFPAWRATTVEHRAALLQKTADLLDARRDPLSAIILRESRKTWSEADADVCEAIDFCRYYAATAIPLLTPQRLDAASHLPGELNHLTHIPRGPALIIAPWNFPLAILTGMTVAALVTGNTVLMKPAEQSPAIARALAETLWSAGVPRDVLHFLPAPGETVAAPLVRDPRIALIAFTGSKAVGLDILQAAATTAPDQSHLKRIVVEMGGKNAIIVDSSADLDEAVAGVRHSAFSYAGQKCSACSRCIVLDDIYDLFLSRLVAATASLTLGDPADPATDIPPVIDAEAANKIRRYIQIGQREATQAYPPAQDSTRLTPDGAPPAQWQMENGKSQIPNLIPPHIFTNVPPASPLATEEIFGPVLAVFRVTTFDEALALANASPYKLTGGIYSRTPSHLQKARTDFRVGNLYLNRPITGALVARQPFGGFGLSGLGSKAGGPHYLLHFLDPVAITENTLRHGFAPDE